MSSWLRGLHQFRLLVLALAAGLVSFGLLQLRDAPVDVLPEFTPPHAEIQTEALGLSAEEVEQLITVPLEADLLNGVEGVETIRSSSVAGLSSIVLVFSKGTDTYRARQLVEERLTQAHALPNVSKPPTLLQPLSSSSRVLMIGMSSTTVSAIEQSVIARWTMRPRLMGVPGVANVAIWGMRDQQVQVQVDPDRLKAAGVTLGQIISSAGNAQVVSPLSFLEASTPGTGGFIETPQQRLQVRHLIEKLADPSELAKVPVAGTGGRLQLGDVTNVTVGHPPLIGDAVVNGRPGLVLVVEKFPGSNTRVVTEGVEAALAELQPGLTGIRTETLFRPADYLAQGEGNLGKLLALGLLLVLVLLAAIRASWRVALVGLVTVPLSALVAGVTLHALGQGFNALILGGVAAAAAVLVDESVAPASAVARRLRTRGEVGHSNGDGAKAPLMSVVSAAVQSTRAPLGFATAVVLLAIVPLAALGGRPGAFLAPLALAYAVAVVAAFLVAVTVAPILMGLLFAGWTPPAREGRASHAYSAALARFGKGVRAPLGAGAALLLAGLVALPFLHTSWLPSFEDRNVLVRLEGAPGTSNTRMTALVTSLSRELGDVSGIQSVGAHVGRAVTGDRVTNVSSSDLWVSIREDADYAATLRSIKAVTDSVQGAQPEVTTYLEQEMRDVGALTEGRNQVRGNGLDVLTGHDRPLVVRVFGQDLGVLRTQAERVAAVVDNVPGASALVDLPTLQPSLEIEVDLERAQRLGLTPGDVRRAEAALLQGIQVGSTFQQQKVFDVVVQGAPGLLGDVAKVRNLVIDLPEGGHTTLGSVAAVREVLSPSAIERDAVSRRLDVVVGVNGRSVASVAKDVTAALAGLALPLEYHAEVLQQSTAQEIGAMRVAGFAVAAAIAALLLFQAAFRSWKLAGLVFAVLPVALVGGMVPALLDGGKITLGAALGLLCLLGLAIRGCVLLVTDVPTRRGHIATVAKERMGPLMATTAVLVVLAAPFAILGTGPGLEVLHPLALTLLAGLVTCTFATAFLLPALCMHLPFAQVPHETDERAGDLVIDLTPRRAADDTPAPGALSPTTVEGNGSK